MDLPSRIARKANVTMHKADDGKEDAVAFEVQSPDGSPLTGQQIIEAVSEAVLLYWEHCPVEPWDVDLFDA